MSNNDFTSLLRQLDVKFQNQDLLQQAFFHRSYLNEVKMPIESNERLEFLGDAVLSVVISYYLYTLRPDDAEGELTNLRAYIVKTKSLAQASKKLELGKYLSLSKGEEISGGRNNPQLLANTYEALLGSLFLDQGLDAVKKVIDKTLLPFFEKELRMGPPKDAKSMLQEQVQHDLKLSPQYKIMQTQGPDHAKQFIVAVYINGQEKGRGKGASKQIAEEEAAKQALRLLT